MTGPVEIAAEAGATPEGALSYAIGYAERLADGAPIAAADVLAGLAQIGWTAAPAMPVPVCICPTIVKADGCHLIICPAAPHPSRATP